MVLFDVVIPVFLMIFLGYTGQKILKLDIKPISTLAIYVLTPPDIPSVLRYTSGQRHFICGSLFDATPCGYCGIGLSPE
ncbi:hypothetical protein SAMN02745133_02739 [Desulforamulus putei DSM 12395]|uniref:Uncharacterized protein n=1 Tax=Desulforamulus putei DSM 12395 TaxID=1121429 RepID=A0A1M5BYM5_9FIRM|nr:hypothetical protein [Desulforamulus putei]SHF47457.1 hypothetical protein SAMN02745133_02739 [Desulforamulus putei DSM 12395]